MKPKVCEVRVECTRSILLCVAIIILGERHWYNEMTPFGL